MRKALALILTVVLAGCGGGPAAQGSPTPTSGSTPTRVDVGRVTLTPDTCLGEFSVPAPEGFITITVVNQRPVGAAFTIWRIGEGHTFAEQKAHADAERHLADTGQPFMGPPDWLIDPDPFNYPIAAGATAVLERVVRRGTYSVSCFAFSERSNSNRVVAAVGPIEVK